MRCSGSIPYGYKREKYDKQQLIIDEPAAEIVRKIFHLSIRFLATYSEERRQKASEYAKKYGLNSQQG